MTYGTLDNYSFNYKSVPYLGGFLEASKAHHYIFTDTSSNDIMLYTDTPGQSILFGTEHGAESALKIQSNNIRMGYNFYTLGQGALGTSNGLSFSPYNRFVVVGPKDTTSAPNAAYYIEEDTEFPIFQQVNLDHDRIYMNFDCEYTGSNFLASDLSAFQISKNQNRLNFSCACNTLPGDQIDSELFIALSINSNSFIGVGTSNADHRFTMRGPDQSYLGSHMAFYTDTDVNNPVYQHLNWSHDDIVQSYDAYSRCNVWYSGSSNGNFQIKKSNGQLLFQSACNTQAGDVLDSNWYVAMSINSNAFIGIGTSNPTNKLTISGIDSSIYGSHTDIYTTKDAINPIYQQLVWNNNDIQQTYGAYYRSNVWIASSSNGNFRQHMNDGRFMIQTACNFNVGDKINWYTALSINSNSFVSIGSSNPLQKFMISGIRSNILGPHTSMVFDDDPTNIVYQTEIWDNDQISTNYDMYFDGSNYISSTIKGNVQQLKQGSQFMVRTASNNVEGQVINDLYPSIVADIETGFIGLGTSNVTHKLTIEAMQPHVGIKFQDDPLLVYQQVNHAHDSIAQTYDAFLRGSNWIASDSNSFQVQKKDGRYMIQTSCNNIPGQDLEWYNAFTINSNGFIGFGTSNPIQKFTYTSLRSNVLGPHTGISFNDDPNNIIYQSEIWDNDQISTNYDMYFNGSNYISSTIKGNVQQLKQGGQFMVRTASNNIEGHIINDLYPSIVADIETGFIGLGTSNVTHKLTIEAMQPHVGIKFQNDPLLVYQQINSTHDSIAQTYDAFLRGSNWIASDYNSFQVQKKDGRYMIHTSCNNIPGADLEWYNAFTINSNGFIGFGTSNPIQKFTYTSLRSNILGPHTGISFNDDPNNIIYQSEIWDNDQISQNYDMYFDGSNYISSTIKGNVQQLKQGSQFMVRTASNNVEGQVIDDLYPSIVADIETGFIGLGTSNVSHKLTLEALQPHVGIKFQDDPLLVYQQVNHAHDSIAQTYDAFLQGSNWIASDSNSFQVQKHDGRYMIQTSCNNIPGQDLEWYNAFTINSNGFIGFGTSNPIQKFTYTSLRSNIIGPHTGYTFDDDPNNIVYQNEIWDNDQISTNYDMYFDGSNYISSTIKGNVQQLKQGSQFMVRTASNNIEGQVIDDLYPSIVADIETGFIGLGTSNVTHKLTLEALQPHVGIKFQDDPLLVYQQVNHAHDSIAQTYDAFLQGNNWIASDSNSFQVQKHDGRYMIHTSCNNIPGADLEWYNAFTINSNGFIGFGTSNPIQKFTYTSLRSNILGPHTGYTFVDNPNNIVYQNEIWDNDQISQNFDMYFDGSNYIAAYSNSFQQLKQGGQFLLRTASNNIEGQIINDLYPAIVVDSTSGFVGLGTSNVTHKLTLEAMEPNIGIKFQNDPLLVYQQVNLAHDEITQSYDAFFDGSNWISSAHTNFKIQKHNNRFMIHGACNIIAGGNIDDIHWNNAFTIDSNLYMGIGISNPIEKLTIMGHRGAANGPNTCAVFDDDPTNIVYEQKVWDNDNISLNFDMHYDGQKHVSSSLFNNYQLAKQDGLFMLRSACNSYEGTILSSLYPVWVADANTGYVAFGTSNVTHKLTIEASNPNIAYYFQGDCNIVYQQVNLSHDQIIQNYDAYLNGSNSFSSSSNASFQFYKSNNVFLFNTASNTLPGQELTWFNLMAFTSNGFVGINTSNPQYTLDIAGDVKIRSNLILSNTTYFYASQSNFANASFSSNVFIANTLSNLGNASFSSNLIVINNTTLSNNVYIYGAQSNFNIVSLSCNLVVNGTQSNFNNASFSCNMNILGDVLIGGTLTVDNFDFAMSNMSVGSNFAVFNNTTLCNQVDVYGTIYIHSNMILSQALSIGGSQTISQNLAVLSNATLCNLTEVFGQTIFYSNLTLSNHGTVNVYTSNNMLGVDNSNPQNKFSLSGPSNSMTGPNAAYSLYNDSNLLFQQLNYNHDNIRQYYDSYWNGTQDISSSSNGNILLYKSNNSLLILTACNVNVGQQINNWYSAFNINTSNGFIGLGTSNPSNKLTLYGLTSNILGPHISAFVDRDSNHAIFQQLNYDQDNISTNYDCYFDGTQYRSSSSNGSFSILKNKGILSFLTACNTPAGQPITLSPALVINSNTFIGVGMSTPSHRFTMTGPSNNYQGPNLAYYLATDSNNPLYQQFHKDVDNISLSFASYWDGFNWISSSSNGNFQLVTRNGKFIIQSSTFGYISSNINNSWQTALTVNSNSYIGLHNSNPTYPLDVTGQSLFRSNINVTGPILPTSNSVYNLGSSTNRFNELWVSGNGVDMNNLNLKRDAFSGGLVVYDNNLSEMTRVWAKEILIGDPASLINSNVFLLSASSNGIHFDNVTSNLPPQPFSQFNNLYVLTTNVGIGNSNPTKTFQVSGDVEYNPIFFTNLFWDNNIARLQSSSLDQANNSSVTTWEGFISQFPPIYYQRGGYFDGSLVRCSYSNQYLTTPSNFNINCSTNQGFTSFSMIRFTQDPQPNETIYSFSNNGFFIKLGRSNLSDQLMFQTIDTGSYIISQPSTIFQNEWALYTIRYDGSSNIVQMFKNASNVATISLTAMNDMSFLTGSNIYIGNANIDISSIYMFDRYLTDSELYELSSNLMNPGHQSFKIRTDYQQYPPSEFFNDYPNFLTSGTRNGGQVYEKTLANMYYANGIYKIWANQELYPTNEANQLITNMNKSTGWLTSNQSYNNTTDASLAPTVYLELPVLVKVIGYQITANSTNPQAAPSKWNLYTSTNNILWMKIDTQTNQTGWGASEQRIFNTNTTASGNYFKLEFLQNDSAPNYYIGFSDWILYGDEESFVIDGSGIAINTGNPKEKLTVEGSAYITRNITIGKIQDELKPNTFAYPPTLISSNVLVTSQNYGNGTYTVSQSVGSGYYVFDNNSGTNWIGQTNIYSSTGVYTGSTNTIVSGSGILGDWVQVQLPNRILIKSYSIIPTSVQSAPNIFNLVGSYDGVHWNQIDQQTFTWTNTNQTIFYITTNIYAYQYIRLIIQKVGSGGSSTSVGISTLTYYGDTFQTTTNDSSKLSVYGDILGDSLNLNKFTNSKYWELFKIYNLVDGALVSQWGPVSQDNSLLKPTYFKQGGYKQLPFVRFNNSVLYGGNGTLHYFTNYGFTVLALIKFHGTANNNEQIVSFDNNLYIKRNNTSAELAFYFNSQSLITTTTAIVQEQWGVYGFRFNSLASNKIEIFQNNSLIASSYTTAITNDLTYNQSFIGSNATIDIGALYIWDTPISDSILAQETDILMNGVPNLYVNGQNNKVIQSTNIYNNMILSYPPSDLITNNSYLYNQLYGNGSYTVKASSIYNSNDSYNAYNAFLSTSTNGWQSASNSYNGLGNYIGNSETLGDWIQMQLPENIIPTAYSFSTMRGNSWKLYGSPNGVDWTTLDTKNSYVSGIISITNTTSYNYIKLIILSISFGNNVDIKSFKCYGKSLNTISATDDKLIVFGNLGIGTSNPLSALTVAGNTLPSSNLTYNLGASNYRFNSLYTNTISLSNLTLSVDSNSGGLSLNNNSNGTSRLIAKELLIGDPTNSNNSNQILIIATSNGLQVQANGNSNFNQMNNAYFTSTSLGIGISNPSTLLEVFGNSNPLSLVNNLSSNSIYMTFIDAQKDNAVIGYDGYGLYGSNNAGIFTIATQCNNPIRFMTSNVERLRINSNGDILTYGNFTSQSNMTINGTLTVNNIEYVTSNIFIYNSEIIQSNLTVENFTTLCNLLNVYGVQSNFNNVDFTCNLTINSNLVVLNNTTLSNNVTIYGTLSNNANANFSSNVNIQNNLVVLNNTTLSNNVTIYGTLSNNANASFASNVLVNSNLVVLNNTTLSNNVTIYGTLSNNANASFASNVIIQSNLSVQQNTTLCNSLLTLGNTTLCNNLVIGNTLIANSNVTFCNSLTVNSNLSVAGNITIGGVSLSNYINTISSNLAGQTNCNSATFGSNVVIQGTLLVNKFTTLSNTTYLYSNLNVYYPTLLSNTLDVYQTGTFWSNLVVKSNADLYGTVNFWSNVNIPGTLTVSNLISQCNIIQTTTTLSLGSNYSFSNGLISYGLSTFWSNVYINGTVGIYSNVSLCNMLTTYGVATFNSNVYINNLLIASSPVTFCNSLFTYGVANFYSNVNLQNTLVVSSNSTFCNSLNVYGQFNAWNGTVLSNTVISYGVTSLLSNVITSNLNVYGAAILYSNVTINQNLAVTGSSTINGNATFGSNVYTSNNLAVYGSTTLCNGLYVTGSTTVNSLNTSNIFVNGNGTFNSNLTVNGITNVSNLVVNGTQTNCNTALFQSNVTILGSVLLSNNINIYGPVTVSNTTNFAGITTFSNTVVFSSNIISSGSFGLTSINATNATISNLVISGTSTFSNTIFALSNINTNSLLSYNNVTFCNSLNIASNLLVQNNITACNSLSAGSLNIAGTANLSNNLNVYGTASFFSNIVMNSLVINSNMTTCNNFNAYGNVYFWSNLEVNMNIIGNSNTTLCNLTVTNIATFSNNAQFNQNLVALSNVTFCNSLNANNITSSNITINSNLNVYGTTLLSNNVNVYGNTYYNSNVFVNGVLTANTLITFSNDVHLTVVQVVGSNSTFCNSVDIYGITTLHSNLITLQPVSFCNEIDAFGNANFNGPVVINNTLLVQSNVSLCNNLNVNGSSIFTGLVTLCNKLLVSSNATFSNDINVIGNAYISSNSVIGGNLVVNSNTTLCNSLAVSGLSTFYSNAIFNKTVTLNSNITIFGPTTSYNSVDFWSNVTFHTPFIVSSNVTFCNTIQVYGPLYAYSNLASYASFIAYSNATLSNGFLSYGPGIFLSNLIANNTSTFCNIVNIQSNLNLTGQLILPSNSLLNIYGQVVNCNATFCNGFSTYNTANFYSNLIAQTNLIVLSNATFCNGFTALGLTTFNGLSNSTYIGTGTTTLSNTLTVYGTTTFNSNVILLNAIASNITVSNNFTVFGNTLFTSNVNITNALTVNSNVSLCNNLLINGILSNIGNANFSSNVIIQSNLYVVQNIVNSNTLSNLGNASFSSNIIIVGNQFNSNTLSNLGNASFASNVIIQSNLYVVQNIVNSNTLSNLGNASFRSNVSIQSNLYVLQNLFNSNTLSNIGNASFGSNVVIQSNLYVAQNIINSNTLSNLGNASFGGSILLNNTSLYGSNNYFGVGKSNPSFAIDILGDVNFTGILRSNGIPYIGSQWSNNNSNIFLLGSNVGIGTSNPVNLLTLSASSTNSNATLMITNLSSNSLRIGVNDSNFSPYTLVGDSFVQSDCNLVLSSKQYGTVPNILTTSNSPNNPHNLLYATQLNLSNLTPVSSWGGFTQSVSSQQPIYHSSNGFSNLPYVSFLGNSSSNYLTDPNQTYNIATNGGFTLISFIRFTNNQTNTRLFSAKSPGSIEIIQMSSAFQFTMTGPAGNFVINTNNIINFNHWGVYTFRVNASTGAATVYDSMNLISTATTTYTSNVTITNNYIGNDLINSYLSADISYLAIYDSFIPDSTLSNLLVNIFNPTAFVPLYNNLVITTSNIYTYSNVGIGKSNPSFMLDVNGDLNFSGTLRQGGVPYIGSQWSNNSSNVFILSSNVGINKSNPTFPLDVNGDLNFTGILRQGGIPYIGSQWSNNSSNVFILSSNIGIGTSTPTAPLTVNGSASIGGLVTSTGIQIFQDTGVILSSNTSFTPNVTGFSNDNLGVVLSIPNNSTSNYFKFTASNQETMRLSGNGFLGINTSNPTAYLHVNGTSLFSGQAIMLSNQTNPFLIIQNNIGTALMGIASTGTVFSTDAAAGDFIIKSFTGNKLILQSSNVGNALCINSNNCVGIGNAAALYPLDVIGNARFQGLTGTGNRSLYVDPNGLLTINPSDSNLKQNVQPIPYGLSNILQLNPITYYWKDNIQLRFGSQKEIGLIAQEVFPIIPEIVHQNKNGFLSLDYEKIVPVLIKSIQELNQRISVLESKIL